VSVGYAPYRPREEVRVSRLPIAGAITCTIALLAAAALLMGRALAPAPGAAAPIENVAGIPVGVEHSPAGALAAADSYVSVAYATIERDPTRYARLIGSVYAPAIRAGALGGGAAIRSQNPAAMALWSRGGQNLSVIGARRLDYYGGAGAQVSTWNADVYWGPGRPPKQAWVLTQTSLPWSGGRWLVTSTETLPTAGPVPAMTPQASRGNDSAAGFDSSLAGFSAPSYGAGA
jgi:hypothetical protein